MKLMVVADKTGKIISTAHVPVARQGDNAAPTEFGILPRRGHRLYEVEVPASLVRTEALHRLHTNYYLKIRKDKAELTERRPRSRKAGKP